MHCVQVVKLFLKCLGAGLPLEARLVALLAAFIESNMPKFLAFEVLVAWHAFAHHNFVHSEFEQAAMVYLEAHVTARHCSEDVYVNGKARQVQRLWNYHGRQFEFPSDVERAISYLIEVRANGMFNCAEVNGLSSRQFILP